jgi:AcrR family transcriptional regulator
LNEEFNSEPCEHFLATPRIVPGVIDRTAPTKALDARIVRTRHDVLHAAIDIVVTEGLDALTQPNVARRAGYSKATVYAHWPDRLDLVREAFALLGEMPHHVPTGDLRADLVGELHSFRRAMEEHRLDRVLGVLAERSTALPELVPIRDRFVAEGERPIRMLLARHLRGARLDAAVLMLCGAIVHAALMRGDRPSDAVIARAVDAVVAMVDATGGKR